MDPSDKHSIRTTMLQRRRDLDRDGRRSGRVRERLERALASMAPRVVVAYGAVRGEPDLGPWIDACRGRGLDVRVPGSTRDAEPPDVSDADVVVVPGVAFTRGGDRLGRGAGWYDRVLATVPRTTVIVGVCFDEQVVDALPVDPHDVAMALVVTDAHTHRCRGEVPSVP